LLPPLITAIIIISVPVDIYIYIYIYIDIYRHGIGIMIFSDMTLNYGLGADAIRSVPEVPENPTDDECVRQQPTQYILDRAASALSDIAGGASSANVASANEEQARQLLERVLAVDKPSQSGSDSAHSASEEGAPVVNVLMLDGLIPSK
jgi:hypothetical protein